MRSPCRLSEYLTIGFILSHHVRILRNDIKRNWQQELPRCERDMLRTIFEHLDGSPRPYQIKPTMKLHSQFYLPLMFTGQRNGWIAISRVSGSPIQWHTNSLPYLIQVCSVTGSLREHQKYIGITKNDKIVICRFPRAILLCICIPPLDGETCIHLVTILLVITILNRNIPSWVPLFIGIPKVVGNLIQASTPRRQDMVIHRGEHGPIQAIGISCTPFILNLKY